MNKTKTTTTIIHKKHTKLPKPSKDVLNTLKKHPRNGWKIFLIVLIILIFSTWCAVGFNWLFDLLGITIAADSEWGSTFLEGCIEWKGVNLAGWEMVKNVMKYFVWPDRNPNNPVLATYFFSLEEYAVPYLMVETIMIAFLGTLIGAVVSIPFAFVSSRNITGKVGAFFGSLVITLIRTIPIFIWGLLFIRVQTGAMAGVLAISVTSIGMISKMYIEVIEDIDTGILEALDSIGATRFQKIRYGIIPQLTASFLSTTIYRFEINVKNATILGLVGAGGIGFTLVDALGSFNFGIVAICLWGIIIVVFIVEFLSGKLRAKLTTGGQ